MKELAMGFLALAVAGCVPGEAVITLSAENVRRVLQGEIVEVPVYADARLECPIGKYADETAECPICNAKGLSATNFVSIVDSCYRAVANAMTILLADGSCVTGGMKIAGTNVVHWANIDTKFIFGTEAALSVASNKVAECNGCVVIDGNGEVRVVSMGRSHDFLARKQKRWEPCSHRMKRIFDAFEALAENGCKFCGSAYSAIAEALNISEYDSISFVLDGDGMGGFCFETDAKRVASENVGKGDKHTIVIKTKEGYRTNIMRVRQL